MKRLLLVSLLGLALLALIMLVQPRPLQAALIPANGLARATVVSAGLNYGCAVTNDSALFCWGDNGGGQLGDGTTTRRLVPVAVFGLGNGVSSVAAGWFHTCALMNDGTVRCWGTNTHGQLGDGTTSPHLTPMAVINLPNPIVAISAGKNYTCAITNVGALLCWGDNLFGKIGTGNNIDQTTPITVTGLSSGVVRVATGQDHACAVLTSGAVKCWGANGFGQLGNNSTTNSSVPVLVSGLSSGAIEIGAGFNHSCAVLTKGEAKCWGRNEFGKLGNGTTTNSPIPVMVQGLRGPLSEIVAGFSHTCGLTRANGVTCWGANFAGQLGDQTFTNSLTPTQVNQLHSVTLISAGQHHNCARTANGTLKCWGYNFNGQLGNNSTISQNVAICVNGFFCNPPD